MPMSSGIPGKYRAGDAEIDLAAGIIRRDGVEEQLRAQTLRVLRYLIDNRDRLVTREEILDTLWGNAAVSENVVAQSINDLRKAFGDNSRSPVFIKTIPKAGYRFIACVQPLDKLPDPALPDPGPSGFNEALPPVATAGPARRYPMWFWLATAIIGVAGLVIARSVLPPAAHPPVPLREAGWWRFDEAGGTAIEDSSGKGNTGETFGRVRREPGMLGSALVFDGVRAGAQGDDRALAFPAAHRPRTVTAWVRADSSNGDATPIFHYGNWNGATRSVEGDFALTLQLDGRILQGPARRDRSWLVSRRRVDDGRWHHVAAVWTERAAAGAGGIPGAGGLLREAHLYLDGDEDAAGQLASLYTPAGATWNIGGFREGGTSFRGSIDDVRVFDAALTATQVAALYRCSTGPRDAEIGGLAYFMPVFDGFRISPDKPDTVGNSGRDLGGIQFARRVNDCAIGSIKGADVGQDVRISMNLTVPADSDGNISEGGPYFRSRLALPGDGIVGGTSAGYSALLHSTGLLSVLRLNPRLTVAFATVPHFDPRIAHRLEIAAVGERFQASVDGQIVEFDEAGRKTRTVSLPPAWNGPPKVGHNDGAAGVWFGDLNNRGKIGGQAASEIRVAGATSLLVPDDRESLATSRRQGL